MITLNDLVEFEKKYMDIQEQSLYVLGYEFPGWVLMDDFIDDICKGMGFKSGIIYEALWDYEKDYTEEKMWEYLYNTLGYTKDTIIFSKEYKEEDIVPSPCKDYYEDEQWDKWGKQILIARKNSIMYKEEWNRINKGESTLEIEGKV